MQTQGMDFTSYIKGIQGANKLDDFLNVQASGSSDNQTQFKGIFDQALDAVNQTDAAEVNMNKELLTGEVNNLHSVMIAAEKADIVLSLTLQIRNKVIDAYNEIMRMQI